MVEPSDRHLRTTGTSNGDLTPAQRSAVTDLLKVALSADGYRKVTEIIRGDEVLRRGVPPATLVPGMAEPKSAIVSL